jgi:preprotein translocase subunit Sss1
MNITVPSAYRLVRPSLKPTLHSFVASAVITDVSFLMLGLVSLTLKSSIQHRCKQ